MMQIEENGHKMGFSRKFMMENAGAAATKRLVEKFGDIKSKNVLVFAGLGNNGGDGLVIARHLAGYGANVTVELLGEPDNIRSSGVDPDTGNKNLPYVNADVTVTFHRMKVGMPKRKDLCGEIFVEKIGIPPEAEIGVL